MKIGGRAYKNGVALFGENYSVKAYYTEEGRLTYRIGKNILADSTIYQSTRKLPILRGVINLILSIYFFIQEATKQPRRFWPILVLLVATTSIDLYFLLFPTQSTRLVSNLFFLPPIIYWFSLIGLAFILRRSLLKSVFKFHGAEHKAVNYYQADCKQNLSSYSRLARRCGTNLVVVFLILLALISYLGWKLPIYLQTPLLLGVAYEILLFVPDRLLAVPFLLQRFTTIEPDEKELKAARTALEILLNKEEIDKRGEKNGS